MLWNHFVPCWISDRPSHCECKNLQHISTQDGCVSHCRCHLVYRYLSLMNGRTTTSEKPSGDVKESESSGGEDALTRLFVCPEDGRTKKFNTHSLVLCHLDCGKHQYTLKGNMPIYNPPNRFCGLSLDKMITWYKMGRWLSDCIRHPTSYPSSDFISTKERPRKEKSFKLNFN